MLGHFAPTIISVLQSAIFLLLHYTLDYPNGDGDESFLLLLFVDRLVTKEGQEDVVANLDGVDVK